MLLRYGKINKNNLSSNKAFEIVVIVNACTLDLQPFLQTPWFVFFFRWRFERDVQTWRKVKGPARTSEVWLDEVLT